MSPRTRMLRAALIAGLAASLVPPLAACGGLPPEIAPDEACWLELTAAPAQVRSGGVVTVASEPSCSLEVPDDARWTVRLFPDDWSAPVAETEVTPGRDGTFAVDVPIPAGVAPGGFHAAVEGYEEYVECNDTGTGWGFAGADVTVEAACAAPTASIEVVP